MRASTTALLLCSLLLVNDVSGQFLVKRWRWNPWPVRTARRLVAAHLNLWPGQYWLYMDWARAGLWNMWQGRYRRHKVNFRIRQRFWPWRLYFCRADIVWPKFGGPVWFNGGLGNFPNRCW